MMRGTIQSLPAAALVAALAATMTASPAFLNAQDSAASTANPRPAPALPSGTGGAPSTSTSTPQGASAVPAAKESTADRRDRARTNDEDALRKSLIPRPMERPRFVTFLGSIDAPLAANAQLLDAHTLYATSLEKQNETAARQILRLLPAAFNFDAAREVFITRSTPELVALMALRDLSARNANTAERKLLDLVEGAISAEQKTNYSKSMLAWRLEQLPKDALLPSTRVTLLELLAQTKLDSETQTALEPILGTYASALANAFAQRTRILREADSSRAIIETTAGTLWRYAPVEITDGVEIQLATLDDADFASELAIRTIQFDTLARIRARLQPRDGRRLVEFWQRTLHPELFEDERLLSRMVEETLALPSFSDEHDTALLDALETSYQRLEPLSRESCEAADLVLPRLAIRSKDAMTAEIDARIATIDAQHKRRLVVKDALQRLRAMIGDLEPATAARLNDALYTTDSLERADVFDRKSLVARIESLADGPGTNAQNNLFSEPPTTAPSAPTPIGGADAKPAPAGQPPADATESPASEQPARTSRGSRGTRRNTGN